MMVEMDKISSSELNIILSKFALVLIVIVVIDITIKRCKSLSLKKRKACIS
jgi:hypothetical protein